MQFRFRFDKILDEETNAAWGFDKKSPEQALEVELGSQIIEVAGNIYGEAAKQGISPEQLNEKIAFVEKIAEAYRGPDETQFEDIRLTKLIGYANALGGVLKIGIELDNGDTVELL